MAKLHLTGNSMDVLEARMKDNPYLTYRKIKEVVNQMTEEQLDQPVQVFPPSPVETRIELQPVISIDLLGNQCSSPESDEQLIETRGCLDNKHHPEHFVLSSDYNPHDEDGNLYYEWDENGDDIGENGFRYVNTEVSLEITNNVVKATHVRIRKKQKSAKTVELIPGLLLTDYNVNGELIGIEILKPFEYTVKTSG